MTKYSFAIQWPEPFARGWLQSSRVFPGTESAAHALAEYLAISADNGTIMEGKLVVLPNHID